MIASTTVLSSLLYSYLYYSKGQYAGLYGEEFEEGFAVSTLGNPSGITDSIGDDDAGVEF
jgi:hypothetical protein